MRIESLQHYYRFLWIVIVLPYIAGCGSNFSESDHVPPSLVSTNPSFGATDVPISTAINATFSEDVTVSAFTVTAQSGKVLNGSISGNGTSMISLTTSTTMNFGTKYTAKITNIRDSSGNKLVDQTWTFTSAGNDLTYHATPDSHDYDVGKFNSVAVSPVDGRSYMAYFNSTRNSLYIISTGDGTSFEGPYLVESSLAGSVGKYSSLAIDSAGNLHISYYHDTVGLKYATAAAIAGPWSTVVVDGGGASVGTHTSIALDTNGKAHISYYDQGNTALKYATDANGSWQKEIVDSGLPQDNPGQYTSVKVDDSNIVHISYYDYHASVSNGNLKYVEGTFGNWNQRLTLDSTGNVGEFSSMALSRGKVFIAYNHLYPDGHRYITIITNASGEWRHDDIVEVSKVANDTTSLTSNPLAFDSRGIAYISYYKAGVLYYTSGILSGDGGNTWDWVQVSVDTSEVGQGIYASLAIDSGDNLKIAYYDATDTGLKIAE